MVGVSWPAANALVAAVSELARQPTPTYTL